MRLFPALLAVLALPARAQISPPLEMQWCTGSMPASWGFAITPSEACREVHVRTRSAAVLLQAAEGGPGLPAGWTVTIAEDREAVAKGPASLAAGVRLETFLLLTTNRSTGAVDARGALPVEWGVWFADEAGAPTAAGKMTASFPPVIPLAEAAAKGMVLVSYEGLSPSGPVEITVDNPTWYPVWLDVPTGSVLTAEGRDWIVGSCAPFRMMRKQKTGRTVAACPLVPALGATTPRRLQWGKPLTTDSARRATELAIAADRLEAALKCGQRTPSCPFERVSPWDFWPLALKWATWTATATPPPELLQMQVTRFIEDRAAAGDPAARALDAVKATADVAAAALAIAAEADAARSSPLSLEHRAALERFR